MQGLNTAFPPIANRDKILKPIGNSLLVDTMLEDCKDLIDPNYKKWFAARFYQLKPDMVQRAASEARQDAKQSSQRLFAHIIGKMVKQNTPHY